MSPSPLALLTLIGGQVDSHMEGLARTNDLIFLEQDLPLRGINSNTIEVELGMAIVRRQDPLQTLHV